MRFNHCPAFKMRIENQQKLEFNISEIQYKIEDQEMFIENQMAKGF